MPKPWASAAPPALDRLFVPAVLALLALMGTLQFLSVRNEAGVFDEGIHLASGLSYWKTGDYRISPEHPPLGKMLCALPLLFMDVSLPLDSASWRDKNEVKFGEEFLYGNHKSAGDILAGPRCVTILMSLALGAAIAFWTRKHFGSECALFAVVCFVFHPDFIAHGRYVTTDLVIALTTFVACAMWGEMLQHPTTARSILAGVALGLALTSKFSALLLIPVFLFLAWLRRPGQKAIAIAAAAAYVTILIPYIPDLIRDPLILPYAYLRGFVRLTQLNSAEQHAYLFGRVSEHGFWYYFPAAFLVKSPTAFILLVLGCSAWLAVKRPKLPFELTILALPALAFWLVSLRSHINIGVRHMLPAYALMIPLCAVLAVKYAPRWLTVSLAVLLAVESLSIYPDYLAFFNWPSGGPSRGPHYLVDSNIDWGQDTKKLKAWLGARNIDHVCGLYFGQAALEHYGIKSSPVPITSDQPGRSNLDCFVTANVTALYGPYHPQEDYRWLREQTPIANVGHTIYIYDFRKRR